MDLFFIGFHFCFFSKSVIVRGVELLTWEELRKIVLHPPIECAPCGYHQGIK